MASYPDLDSSDHDARARKRLEIGLSSRRPTAKSVVQRPPNSGATADPSPWFIPLVFVSIIVATLLLLTAQLLDAPITLPQVLGSLESWFSSREAVTGDNSGTVSVEQPANAGLQLYVADNFDTESILLGGSKQGDHWQFDFVPGEGVYRVRAWQGYAALVHVDLMNLNGYRLETTVTIAANSPTGYGGLLARFLDNGSFYLFAIDGQGQMQVRLQNRGLWTTLRPWTSAGALHSAGEANVLTIEDNGQGLRFLGNEVLLFEVLSSELPIGNAGLIGGSQGDSSVQIDFDDLRIYTFAH